MYILAEAFKAKVAFFRYNYERFSSVLQAIACEQLSGFFKLNSFLGIALNYI